MRFSQEILILHGCSNKKRSPKPQLGQSRQASCASIFEDAPDGSAKNWLRIIAHYHEFSWGKESFSAIGAGLLLFKI